LFSHSCLLPNKKDVIPLILPTTAPKVALFAGQGKTKPNPGRGLAKAAAPLAMVPIPARAMTKFSNSRNQCAYMEFGVWQAAIAGTCCA